MESSSGDIKKFSSNIKSVFSPYLAYKNNIFVSLLLTILILFLSSGFMRFGESEFNIFYLHIPILRSLSFFMFLPIYILTSMIDFGLAIFVLSPFLIFFSCIWVFFCCFFSIKFFSKYINGLVVPPLLICLILFLFSVTFSSIQVNSCVEDFKKQGILENTGLIEVRFGEMDRIYDDSDTTIYTPNFPDNRISFFKTFYDLRSTTPSFYGVNTVYAKVDPGTELKTICSITNVFGQYSAKGYNENNLFSFTYNKESMIRLWNNLDKDFCNKTSLKKISKEKCLLVQQGPEQFILQSE